MFNVATYLKQSTKDINIGLKNNSVFLFNQMQGNTLGGWVPSQKDKRGFSKVMTLNPKQFESLKGIITTLGYDAKKSLTKLTYDDVDYECYLKK